MPLNAWGPISYSKRFSLVPMEVKYCQAEDLCENPSWGDYFKRQYITKASPSAVVVKAPQGSPGKGHLPHNCAQKLSAFLSYFKRVERQGRGWGGEKKQRFIWLSHILPGENTCLHFAELLSCTGVIERVKMHKYWAVGNHMLITSPLCLGSWRGIWNCLLLCYFSFWQCWRTAAGSLKIIAQG